MMVDIIDGLGRFNLNGSSNDLVLITRIYNRLSFSRDFDSGS